MFYLREYEHVSDPKFIANLFMQGWGEERTIPHPNIYYRTKKDCRGNSSAVFFNQPRLFQFNLSASFFQLSFHSFSISLGNAFLQGVRSGINSGFGFFQAQAGQFTNNLDYVDLAGTAVSQDNIEFGLFSSSSTAGSTPQAPAVGAATMRHIQALDSAMDSASAMTSLT